MMLNKIEEKLLLKTPVFDVVEKSFNNTDLKPVGLNCKDWVMIVARDGTTRYSNYIFVKQTRWGIEGETIEFPCGTVEDDELPIDAAKREFLEETGISLNNYPLHETFRFNPNPAYFSNEMHIFVVTIPDLKNIFIRRGNQKLDKDEDCQVFISPKISYFQEISKHAMGLLAFLATEV